MRRSPVDGLPISVKDLFDVAGDVTPRRLDGAGRRAAGKADAPAVARLRAAGAVFVGRTNMVEFAFGGVGINPHYGTPKNPCDRKTGRVPGGSSSGARGGAGRRHVRDGARLRHRAARSASRRRCAASPASSRPRGACRATARSRSPTRSIRSGRSPTPSPAARPTTRCSPASRPQPLPELPLKGLRLLLPKILALDDLDAEVETGFRGMHRRAVAAPARWSGTAAAGVRPADRVLQGRRLRRRRGLLRCTGKNAERLGEYDPRVAKRVLLGKDLSARRLCRLRPPARAIPARQSRRRRAVRCVPAADGALRRAHRSPKRTRATRTISAGTSASCATTGLVNFLDGCAASLPCTSRGAAPGRPDGERHCRYRPAHPRRRRRDGSARLPEIDRRTARAPLRAGRQHLRSASRLEAEVGARMLERLDYMKLAPRRILDAGSGPPRRVLGKRYPQGRSSRSISRSRCCGPHGTGWILQESRPCSAPIWSGCRSPRDAIDFVMVNMALHWLADPLPRSRSSRACSRPRAC